MLQAVKNKNKGIQSVKANLGGHISQTMERFLYERINSPEARNVIYQEAEDAFKNKIDDASGVYGIWQGEYWGKWIIGATLVCGYSENENLREFIHKAALKLISYQEEDGYLGTYRNSLMVFPADRKKTEALLGFSCDWNWNIWCRKYTLWGLLEAWLITDDAEILQAAVRLADHLIRQLKENNIRLADTGSLSGLPSCSILKPITMLYEITGNGSYLEFAQDIVNDLMRPDGFPPNIIANALNDVPVHEWYPEPSRWAKVYEMQSCFEGILALYKINRDEKLLEASVKFHRLLKKHELNALFSVGFNDIFANASSQVNAISEICDVIHWMRLCYELFSLTGDKSYIDDFELAFYNPFLAGVYRDGKWGARGVRGCGRHFTALEQAKFIHNHCCVNNIPRAFINMSEAMTMFSEDTLYINLYTEFDCDFTSDDGRISLSVSGNYLSGGLVHVKLNAELKQPVNLKLRIPGWATDSSLMVDGKLFAKNKTDWFEVLIETGQMDIQLQFERQLEIREHIIKEQASDWYRRRWESGDDAVKEQFITEGACSTFVYGPLLLARSKYIGNNESEMFGDFLPTGFQCSLEVAGQDGVMCAFDAEIVSKNKTFKTMLCDYASAANEKLLDDPKFFSIYF